VLVAVLVAVVVAVLVDVAVGVLVAVVVDVVVAVLVDVAVGVLVAVLVAVVVAVRPGGRDRSGRVNGGGHLGDARLAYARVLARARAAVTATSDQEHACHAEITWATMGNEGDAVR